VKKRTSEDKETYGQQFSRRSTKESTKKKKRNSIEISAKTKSKRRTTQKTDRSIARHFLGIVRRVSDRGVVHAIAVFSEGAGDLADRVVFLVDFPVVCVSFLDEFFVRFTSFAEEPADTAVTLGFLTFLHLRTKENKQADKKNRRREASKRKDVRCVHTRFLGR
jgi:hypothetical protein